MSRATVTPVRTAAVTRARSRTERLVDAASTRVFHLPPQRAAYSVTPSIPVRMRDGVTLLTDHYAPEGPALGTVVMRGPYQRAGAVPHVLIGLFASRGYHVVMQSCRGTFGSEGRFVPGENEISDGADTVAWLREQPWFEGRFAAVGGSYLGYTLWSMLMEPPPELVAAVSFVSFHDFFRVVHGTGAFTLNDILDWCDSLARQESATMLRQLLEGPRTKRRHVAAYAGLPVAEGEERFIGAGATWFRDWATTTDPADPYWQVRDLSAALDRVSVPVRFLTGWQDLFVGQTLEEYRRVRDRGVEVSLTVGPWTHANLLTKGGSRVFGDSLEWVDRHLGGMGADAPAEPVSFLLTGADEWRSAPDWPPPAETRTFYLAPGGALTDTPPSETAGSVGFTYDPSDPTPTIGGRLLATDPGYREDSDLARRPDTLVFTSAPAHPAARRGRRPPRHPRAPQRPSWRRPVGAGQRGRAERALPQRDRGLPWRRRGGTRRADGPRARPRRPPVRGRIPHRPARRRRVVPALRAQPRYARQPDGVHGDDADAPGALARLRGVTARAPGSDLSDGATAPWPSTARRRWCGRRR